MDKDLPLDARITLANQDDEDCSRVRDALEKDPTRMLEILKRPFYWPGMKEEVARYIRDCSTCQRSKAPRDRYNGLLQPLPTPEQRWPDLSADFVVCLPGSDNCNTPCTLVDRLTNKYHHAPCTVSRFQP